MGGGCCPQETTCSPNGCLDISDAIPGDSKMSIKLAFPRLHAIVNPPLNLSDDGVNITVHKFLNLTLLGQGQGGQKMQTDTFTPTAPPQTTVTGIKFGEVAHVNSVPQCHPIPEMNMVLLVVVAVAYWLS